MRMHQRPIGTSTGLSTIAPTATTADDDTEAGADGLLLRR